MRRIINLIFAIESTYNRLHDCRRLGTVKVSQQFLPAQHVKCMVLSVFILFAFASTHVFAAANDSSSNEASSGLISAILGVLVPTLLVIGIGGGIYAWLRRNKASFSRFFPRQKPFTNWSVSRSTSTPSFPSPVVARRADQPSRSEGATEQSVSAEAETLESIALKDLEQVLPLREAGHIHEYYESIAVIIKRYVGEKYQIKTLEATTGQILSALPDDLTDSVADHVGEILRTCDMIHFSRHRPSRSELNGIYQTAKEFVERQVVPIAPETDDSEEDVDENSETHEYYRRMMS